ncbi:MAG: cell envelope integrity protein CreD [Gammaproteobacteria bacterium]|nr:cell envelope integrity protein CreD [Gammaproteobacteria bacterium]
MSETDTSQNKTPIVVKNLINFESVTIRFILVFSIIIGLMVPLFLVRALIEERESYFRDAENSVANEWAEAQTITGPFLYIRSTETILSEGAVSQTQIKEKYDVYMPSTFSIEHSSTHEFRKRGIYTVPVFRAQASIEADFSPRTFDEEGVELKFIRFVVGLTDTVGIQSVGFRWNNTSVQDAEAMELYPIGQAVYVDITPMMIRDGGTLKVDLNFRGTTWFKVVPVGDQNTIRMESDWPHPKFSGKPLPDSHYVTADGFTANWEIHSIARGFSSELSLEQFRPPVVVGYMAREFQSPYRDLIRSTTYGILFVVLTLVSILCIQLVSKARFHIVQYGVVGIALVIFFLTVLSLTEHIGFLLGYVLAAVVLTIMNTLYVWFITRQTGITTFIGVFLALLYAALYLVLQLQTYALLIGTLLLILLLGMLMYATRTLRAGDPNG